MDCSTYIDCSSQEGGVKWRLLFGISCQGDNILHFKISIALLCHHSGEEVVWLGRHLMIPQSYLSPVLGAVWQVFPHSNQSSKVRGCRVIVQLMKPTEAM